MKIIKIKNNKLDKKDWQEIIDVLKNYGVIVYPTDTAYALGGIFESSKVINQVLKIKKRKDKKFTLVASSLSQVEKYFKLNSLQKKLAKKYWPGPLSIVVSKNYAVRVPDNNVASQLCQKIKKPLIASSANLSGQKPTYDVKKIIKEFSNKKNQPMLILDTGKLKKTKPSTVVLVQNNKIKVIRRGTINMNQ